MALKPARPVLAACSRSPGGLTGIFPAKASFCLRWAADRIWQRMPYEPFLEAIPRSAGTRIVYNQSAGTRIVYSRSEVHESFIAEAWVHESFTIAAQMADKCAKAFSIKTCLCSEQAGTADNEAMSDFPEYTRRQIQGQICVYRLFYCLTMFSDTGSYAFAFFTGFTAGLLPEQPDDGP